MRLGGINSRSVVSVNRMKLGVFFCTHIFTTTVEFQVELGTSKQHSFKIKVSLLTYSLRIVFVKLTRDIILGDSMEVH